MRLTRIRYGNIPPFTEPVEITFDERVNVFVGPNATGKSRLLSAIDECFNGDRVRSEWNEGTIRYEFYPDHLELTRWEEQYYPDEWTEGKNVLCEDDEFVTAEPEPPVIYIGPHRIGLPPVSELGTIDTYGSTIEETLSGPFCGARLRAAIELLYAKTRTMFDEERQMDLPIDERRAAKFLRVEKVSHSCAKAICEEVITSEVAVNYPTGLFMDDIAYQPMGDWDGLSMNRMLGVFTSDTPTFHHIRPADRPTVPGVTGPKPIYAGDLSSGSQSVHLWILWLAFKMLNHYEFAEGWNEKPAILLIDEIENHLHPTWQRRVIPALLKHFPGLQIFAATHSPFVVAGLRTGQVHMLNRDADGVVRASTNERDIIGWTTDEILRTFMGVDEPTDQLTVDRSNRLRELRGKDDLTDAESDELAQLRRRVNEDFISSSTPLEEQRERYGDMMLEFLQSRQSELSQDGS